jgi:hypothetical protein
MAQCSSAPIGYASVTRVRAETTEAKGGLESKTTEGMTHAGRTALPLGLLAITFFLPMADLTWIAVKLESRTGLRSLRPPSRRVRLAAGQHRSLFAVVLSLRG